MVLNCLSLLPLFLLLVPQFFPVYDCNLRRLVSFFSRLYKLLWRVWGANIISLQRSIMSKTLCVYNELLKAELPGVTVFDAGQRTAHFGCRFLLTKHISFIIHWFDTAVFGARFPELIIHRETINFQSRLWSITTVIGCCTACWRCTVIGCSQYFKRKRSFPIKFTSSFTTW